MASSSLSLPLSQIYPLQCPLNTSPLRNKILELFPEYLDCDSKERRLKSCRRSIDGVAKLLKEHSDNAEVVQFVKEKLQIAIHQNPYPECFQLFKQAYTMHFKGENDEDNIDEASLFFPNGVIPNIQELGKALQDFLEEESNNNNDNSNDINNSKNQDYQNIQEHNNQQQQGEQSSEEYQQQSQQQQQQQQTSSEAKQKQLPLSWPVIQNEVSNDDFQMILGDIFNTNLGRIPQLERLFCWFPDFLTKFHYAVQTIFQAPGPIPIDQRYFIAILASSNFGCEYLHSKLSQQYLDCGGSIELLEGGFEKADAKMQALASFISQLAYQPFDIPKNPKMIQDLLDKGWQKNELVQSAFIISFYHGLSCICQALGLKSELDLKNSDINMQTKNQTPIGSNLQSPREKTKGANDDKFDFTNLEIEKILSEMTDQQGEGERGEGEEEGKTQSNGYKSRGVSLEVNNQDVSQSITQNTNGKLQQGQQQQQPSYLSPDKLQDSQASTNQQESSQTAVQQSNEQSEPLQSESKLTQQQQQQQQPSKQLQSQSTSQTTLPSSQAHRKSISDMLSPKDNTIILSENDRQVKNMLERFKKFIANPTFSEERVARSLKQSEFAFSIHGVDMCNRYAAELSQSFLELFQVVKTMTNRNLCHTKGLSTAPFRKAIELYVENIFGYARIEADYKNDMNALLSIPLKTLIQMSVKKPFAVKASQLKNINLDLMPSEVSHIILLAIFARVEIELVFFLHAFSKF